MFQARRSETTATSCESGITTDTAACLCCGMFLAKIGLHGYTECITASKATVSGFYGALYVDAG
jgi:hypothetical protein